jgi:ribonucleoside-triphosphate reductase
MENMSKNLPTDYQTYIHLSRYSRWLPEKNRRETWDETVKRYFSFFQKHLKQQYNFSFSDNEWKELEDAVLNLEVMPSMRALMTAGPALERCHVAGYNCSYISIDSPRAFDEILYVLMNGTGVGFSVERQFVSKLPEIPEELYETDTTIIVADSKIGWAKALKELIAMLYTGQIPRWDISKVRPAGSPLKTFGGRASGPEPLVQLFNFIVRIFKQAKGRRLQSVECHDIVCKIAEVVVVGGVRRSALISLSNLSDDRMRHAKNGQWWNDNGQRALANNSAAYTEMPDVGIFMDEWKSLYDSKSGERGIFNRVSAQKQAEKFGRREPNHNFGTNPCGEILLRSNEFCNLSEVVIRAEDTKDTLKRKIKVATILGTIQSTMTDFKYISKKWKMNCEEERLLGVSLTGIMDNSFTATVTEELKEFLREMRDFAIEINRSLAGKFGINPSVAVTCVKPSGTVSALVDSASGIHPRHSEYYIRTIRADNKDPLCQMMKDIGFPYESCVMKPENVTVFSFPIKAPDNCITKEKINALEHLNIWQAYYENWCEHNPSVTVSVRENEWIEVSAWVYKHFNQICGISFLPYSDFVYKQAPFQECSKEQYEALLEKMPKNVDWSKLSDYEIVDTTTSSQELACVGNSCEVADVGL